MKEVAKALGKYAPEYAVEWGDECGGGQTAQVMGWRMYESDETYKTEEYKLLSTYLEADVFGTFQILKWLRTEAADIPIPQSTSMPKSKAKNTPKKGTLRKSGTWYKNYAEECSLQPSQDGWYSRLVSNCLRTI